jgi:hypothetical protein
MKAGINCQQEKAFALVANAPVSNRIVVQIVTENGTYDCYIFGKGKSYITEGRELLVSYYEELA